ncbi:MAG TPA: Trm112 family protein [Chloroflexia bacterium]|nr:Trm112 family protein [Chloroflexia bacterium]
MTDNSTKAADLPQDLLDLLVCPLDKAKVHPEGMTLVCEKCGRAYPVRDGIPIMIIDEAELPASDAGAEK